MSKSSTQSISQESLKEILFYDDSTGIFYWVSNYHISKIGNIAGSKQVGGYIRIKIKGQRYFAHRLAWLYVHGEFPGAAIDHVNGVTSDNRIENLRNANASENMMNRGRTKLSTSGFKGVTWNKKADRWQASGKLRGKCFYLGVYKNPLDAANAYFEWAKMNHGKFFNGIQFS